MRPNYPLLTRRLLLRPFEPDDSRDLFAYRSRPDVCRYLYEVPLATLGEVREPLARKMAQTSLTREGDSITLAVVLPQLGRVIGDVLLHYRSSLHRQGEIGFVFHPDHQGQGYAAEAARAILRLGFQSMQMHRIIGQCDARNLSSARLMERLGMLREAHLIENEFVKGEWTDELVYAIRERSWRDSGLAVDSELELPVGAAGAPDLGSGRGLS